MSKKTDRKTAPSELIVRGLTTETDVSDSVKKGFPELENCMIKILELDPFAICKNIKPQDKWELQIRKVGKNGQLEVVQIEEVKTEIHNDHNEKLRILSIKGDKPIKLTNELLNRLKSIM